jgi:hypothetical protein
MSSPLAIAAVTAVLKSFLENGLGGLAGMLDGVPTVSVQPPDRIKSDTAQTNRINLFLFQATENPAWRNLGLPSRGANGDRIANPPLALNLHYLVTAYGSGDFHAEVLLGHAMFVLHEMPVLTRDAIRAAISAPAPGTLLNELAAANLADQIEQIKITPQSMSVEEISKIWSALHTQYRPTAVYQASVVLIQSERSVPPTLPVRARNLLVLPFERSVIDLIQSQESDGAEIVTTQAILPEYNLVIDGRRLRGETTQVLIDGVEALLDDTRVTDSRIILRLPPELHPGLHSVQVAHPARFGTPPNSVLRRGVESNVAAFVLAPKIKTTPIPDTPHNTTLTLEMASPVGRMQRVSLLIGDRAISIPARDAGGPSESDTLNFPIPEDFPASEPLLRVQIDGAESPLEIGASGKYEGPKVKIT